MRILKYLAIFLIISGLGISAWIYYPQYQINRMKHQAVQVSKDPVKVSYIKYFQESKQTQIYHLAIGDSIIRGVGAQQDSNLVYQFSNKLGEQIHKQIEFKNEGISGITSSELNSLVQKGTFDEEIKKANIVTINVGGNDILRLARRQNNFHNVLQSIDQVQTAFSNNLQDISRRIHTLNPNTTIIFLELYNPLPPSTQIYPLADKLLPKWNLKIYEVANQYPSSVVVETTKVINGKRLDNLSPDGVHPNSAGYTAISEQIILQLKHQYRKQAV